ncbi:MAG: trypsin-like peptidase domain-containing protein [Verrucomicrobia bacterium]|nr:trypsin-like peptidase domain-containing protein [Verrucomicrobiota bacterium]
MKNTARVVGDSGIQHFFALILCLCAAESAIAAEDSRRDATVRAVESAMPSVVNISTETVVEVHDPLENVFRDFFGRYWGRYPQQSLGSGVIFDEEGYILTNLHVVRRASRITVTLADGRIFEAKPLVGTTKTDVALLKLVTAKDEKFQAVRFAKADDLLLGETVLALGNPFGLGGTVTKGILSSKARRPPTEVESLAVADWLQTDAAINPGNSGGPLVNIKGELIGLNVAIFKEGQGIGFAIPISRVTEALTELFTPERMKSMWFGARIEARGKGLTVAQIEPESPAELAGLKLGDRVIRVNNTSPESVIEFNREIIATNSGSHVRITVDRKGTTETINVQLIPESAFFNDQLISQKLGVELKKVTPEMISRMGNRVVEGLIVTDVERDGPADKAGLKEGHILRGINGEAVDQVLKAAQLVHAKKSGERIRLNLVVPRSIGHFLQLLSVDREAVVR